MANRSYLYSLSNQPTTYDDRPETISGLSEWAYTVPFTYRVLMSAAPRICSSLISDGFDSERRGKKSKLYAISSEFEAGLARLKKLFLAIRSTTASTSPDLVADLDSSLEFLEAHRDRYLLLETIELDCMTHEGEVALRSCVEREVDAILKVGTAIDKLPTDPIQAGQSLGNAIVNRCDPPLDAFYGLRLEDDSDNESEFPLGLYWDDVLYFSLWNRAEFNARAK